MARQRGRIGRSVQLVGEGEGEESLVAKVIDMNLGESGCFFSQSW